MTWRRIAPWVILITLALAVYIDLPRDWLPSTLPGTNIKTVLGLDLQGGIRVTLAVKPQPGQTISDADLETARNIIERRVGGIGVSEPQVRTETAPNGERRIIVEVPGVSNADQVRELVGSTGLGVVFRQSAADLADRGLGRRQEEAGLARTSASRSPTARSP